MKSFKQQALSLLVAMGCFVSHSSNAASFLQDMPSLKGISKVFQAGGYYGEMGKAQHIGINGAVGNDFSVADKKTYNGVLGAGLYAHASDSYQYGVNAFYLNNQTVDGLITQEGLFTNLGYHYHANHLPIYAMLRANRLFNSALNADIGVGPNVMFLGDVKERSLDGGVTIPDNAFRAHTNVTLSATAGIDMQVADKSNHPVHCGYRFFYLGEGRFAKSTNQLLNHLKTGTGYAHALMCGITV